MRVLEIMKMPVGKFCRSILRIKNGIVRTTGIEQCLNYDITFDWFAYLVPVGCQFLVAVELTGYGKGIQHREWHVIPRWNYVIDLDGLDRVDQCKRLYILERIFITNYGHSSKYRIFGFKRNGEWLVTLLSPLPSSFLMIELLLVWHSWVKTKI